MRRPARRVGQRGDQAACGQVGVGLRQVRHAHLPREREAARRRQGHGDLHLHRIQAVRGAAQRDIQPEAGKPALKLVVDLDSAKESGSSAVDRSALEAGIASAEAALAGVVVSADGSDVSTEGMWVFPRRPPTLSAALSTRQARCMRRSWFPSR